VDAKFGEECDDGVNQALYGDSTKCAPGCRKPGYCGDGKVDARFGEQCDDGGDNVAGGTCNKDCILIVL
jgi:cysteine-rich repeat protein